MTELNNEQQDPHNTRLMPSSRFSKSSSSSDTSDDDDDTPMQRIRLTIRPEKAITTDTPVSEEDQNTKILKAMREIAANIGETSTNSRRLAPVHFD